ncbi:gluconokinase [Blastococcus sp. SYSU D00820]
MTGAPAEVVIGLDVGTTAVKAVAFDPASPWRASALRGYPLLQPAPGHQVQDPAAVLDATLAALAECVAACGGARVLAVSVSTAMHGLLALDADRRPLTPLLTWADSRATVQARALRADGSARDLHRITGTPVHPMSPLIKLVWFRLSDPDTFARARWWVGLKDLVLLELTGRLVTELSSASATGLLDLATAEWSPLALSHAGVAAGRLPEVLSPTALLELATAPAARVGLPAGTPVVAGAADGPLGNLGTGALSPGTAGLSLGTSGAVRMVVDRPRTDPDGRLFCYALTPDAWVVGGAISNGAHVVDWAGRALAPDLAASSEAALLELAAAVPAGSEGLVMLPYLVAERAPLWDPDVPGAYLGLQRRHGRGHLVRAAVEGVALQLAAVVDLLDGVEPVREVRATGGAFRSPLWRSAVAAAIGRPVVVTDDAGGSALGAAALGWLALGRADRLADAAAVLGAGPASAAPHPVAAADVAAFARLRQAVPEVLGRYAAVAGLHAGRR